MATEMKIRRMSEVQLQEVAWLWKPYIPFGKITIIQGDPGEGKTHPTAENAATVNYMKYFFEGEHGISRCNSRAAPYIYLSKVVEEKTFTFFKKGIDKCQHFVYNTIGILRQQVPVKAHSFPAEV